MTIGGRFARSIPAGPPMNVGERPVMADGGAGELIGVADKEWRR
ncbi:hypothetical protein [Micromonospora orduensis]